MARQHNGFVRQSENLLADAANEQLKIAPREIRPADAPGKEHVTVEQQLLGGGIEAEAAGTVTRNKKHPERDAAKIDLGRFVNQKVRLHRLRFQKEAAIFEKVRVSDERDPVFVESNLALGCLLDFGRVVEMVEVPVREHQQIKSDPKIPDPFRGAGRSIDQDISSCCLNQVGVGIKNTANKSLKVEHSEWRIPNLDKSDFWLNT